MQSHVPPTDETLALGVQQGQAEAMQMLVERYYAALLAYAYRLCMGQQQLAEDLTQETFLRVLRGIGSYHYPHPFKPWIYTIATNVARNHFNKADTRYTASTDENFDAADESEQPEETILREDAAQTVLYALQRLPNHQREVLVLFYYQELSQQEIAATLNIPLGTVKSRLSIGLRRLRDTIERKEVMR